MSRLTIKRAAAAVCAAAMASSLTACGQNTTWGAEIDGTQVPAGVFITYLQSAYYDAQTKLQEQNAAAETVTEAVPSPDAQMTTAVTTAPSLYSSEIDGVSAKQWIYDQATKSMQEYIAVENKFTEYGLSVSDEDTKEIKLYCEQMWDYYGEYYVEMGVSMESFVAMQLNSAKRNSLFNHIYGEGGESAVADDAIKAHMDENYVMINYIDMELKDGEGNLLKSDGKAERMAMAEEYIARFESGEDLDVLNAEYTAYYDNLIAEAAAAAESADGTETAEVSDIDAQAPLAEEEDSVAGDVTEAPVDAETADETEATTVAETEAAVAETEAAESEAAAAPAEDVSAGNAEIESNKQVITRESTNVDSLIVTAVFDEMAKGEAKVIESADGEHYYIVAKLDILENDDYFTAAKDSLLFEMMGDEYDALVASWTESQNVVKNQEAYDRYDPEKIFAVE